MLFAGPPLGLNLRNLVWHGFVDEVEFDRRYVVFLVVLMASLARLMRERGIEGPQRDVMDYGCYRDEAFYFGGYERIWDVDGVCNFVN